MDSQQFNYCIISTIFLTIHPISLDQPHDLLDYLPKLEWVPCAQVNLLRCCKKVSKIVGSEYSHQGVSPVVGKTYPCELAQTFRHRSPHPEAAVPETDMIIIVALYDERIIQWWYGGDTLKLQKAT